MTVRNSIVNLESVTFGPPKILPTTIHREFCFRWTCPECRTANRISDVCDEDIPRRAKCCSCNEWFSVKRIVYENGAEVKR